MSRLGSLVREPLVHFLLIGLALFAVDAWRAPHPARTSTVAPASTLPPTVADAGAPVGPRTIVIDDAARTQIAEAAQLRLGRAATPVELAQETARWSDEEVLYREAIARGLDRDDPVIHQRVAGRMSYVLEQTLAVPEPTEAELRAWFGEHQDQWAVSEHVDFTHVFVAATDAAGDSRADQLAAALAAGAAPETLGDRFSGGHRYRGRKPVDLAEAFGAEFVAGLATQPVGTWVKRRSRHGMHLVRVDRVDAPRGADFTAARLDVRKAWLDAKRAEALTAAMHRLRAAWTVEQR